MAADLVSEAMGGGSHCGVEPLEQQVGHNPTRANFGPTRANCVTGPTVGWNPQGLKLLGRLMSRVRLDEWEELTQTV